MPCCFFTRRKTNLIWKHGHKTIPANVFFSPLVRRFCLGFFPFTARLQSTRPRRPCHIITQARHRFFSLRRQETLSQTLAQLSRSAGEIDVLRYSLPQNSERNRSIANRASSIRTSARPAQVTGHTASSRKS